VLDQWDTIRTKFVKVMPRDYKRVLMERKRQAEKLKAESAEVTVG